MRRYSWEVVIFELNKDVQMMLSPVYEIIDQKLSLIPALSVVPCTSYVCHLNSRQIEASNSIISTEWFQSIQNFVHESNNPESLSGFLCK
jgi:hypothetical protein